MSAATNIKNPIRIYVAHRYSCSSYPKPVIEILASIGRAVEAGVALAKMGHHPFIPHLDCLLAMQARDLPVQWYLENSMDWLKQCQAILILDREDLAYSKGVAAEFEAAEALGIPVFFSLNEIVEATA